MPGNSPSLPYTTITPAYIRDTLQRQIQHTVNRAVDDVTNLSVGGYDGRFLLNFPARRTRTTNSFGQFYFITGVSLPSSLAVAAP